VWTTTAGDFIRINGVTIDRQALINDRVSKSATDTQTIASSLGVSGEILSKASTGGLISDTIDGSDNKTVRLSGGGAGDPARGATIRLRGNEVTTVGGDLELDAGNGLNGDFIVRTNIVERFRITKAGMIHNKTAEAHNIRSIGTNNGTSHINDTDYLLVFTGTNNMTANLPATVAGQARQIIIKNRSTGTITVNRTGSDTIDGGTSVTLTTNQSVTLIANGSDWCVIS
jgi:hypothetical protein